MYPLNHGNQWQGWSCRNTTVDSALAKQRFKLYKFSATVSNNVQFNKDEIHLTTQTILLGDKNAKQKANELLKKLGKRYTHIHLLREVIQNSSVTTVGGQIQCGLFRNNMFKTYGIIEYEKYQDECDFIG